MHGIGHSITATNGTPHGVALAAVAGPAMRFGMAVAPGPHLVAERQILCSTMLYTLRLCADSRDYVK